MSDSVAYGISPIPPLSSWSNCNLDSTAKLQGQACNNNNNNNNNKNKNNSNIFNNYSSNNCENNNDHKNTTTITTAIIT